MDEIALPRESFGTGSGTTAFLAAWSERPAPGCTLVLVSLTEPHHHASMLGAFGPAFVDRLGRAGLERVRSCLGLPVAVHPVGDLCFVAVMPSCLVAESVASAAVLAFASPLMVEGEAVPVAVGIGLRAVDRAGDDAATLLGDTFAAARQSRSKPLGWSYFHHHDSRNAVAAPLPPMAFEAFAARAAAPLAAFSGA
jgi:hypothetical protein